VEVVLLHRFLGDRLDDEVDMAGLCPLQERPELARFPVVEIADTLDVATKPPTDTQQLTRWFI
jgi:hypothetical protein